MLLHIPQKGRIEGVREEPCPVRKESPMITTPDCICFLEDRIQSNVTFSRTTVRGERLWMVEAKCTRVVGFGRTLPQAVDSFLAKF